MVWGKRGHSTRHGTIWVVHPGTEWTTRSCVRQVFNIKRRGSSLVPWGGGNCLVWIIPHLAGNWNLLLRDKQYCIHSFWQGDSTEATLSMGAQWGGELVVRSFEPLSILPAIKTAHNIVLILCLNHKKRTQVNKCINNKNSRKYKKSRKCNYL